MLVLFRHLAVGTGGVYGRGPWGWAGADPKGGTFMVRKALLMMLLAAVIVPAAQAGNGNGKAKPLDPTQAQVLVSNAGASLGATVTPISKEDALAAARQAGA